MKSTLQAFQLQDQSSNAVSFDGESDSIVCFVKEDCPTCNLIAPILERIHQTNSATILLVGQTVEGNKLLIDRHGLTVPVLDDSKLAVSFAYDLEFVPHLFAKNGDGFQELVGFTKSEWRNLVSESCPNFEMNWDELPDWRPACGSLTQDPIIASRLRAEFENAPLRARKIDIAPRDDVHEFMYDQGFTDGFPVIPPTAERVMRMLSGTAREPQDEVTVVPPNLAPATVEKVAINAVMAGCKPDFLPVVITTLEAICTDEFNCHGVFATTMGASPVMIINGPIRHEIDMNMKMSALGQGSRANAAIGRAVRLCVRNIGGARPSGTERSTLGNPMKYSMCFAEWEERSPWEPLHVERGFAENESVVSVFAMSSGPAQVIDQTSRTAEQLCGSFAMSMRAIHHIRSHRAGDAILVISPEHIDTLQTQGFTKDDVRTKIQELSSVPLRELVADDRSGAGIPKAAFESMDHNRQNELVPKFASKDHIHIVVAGSEAGKFSAVFHGWASGAMGSVPVSRKIPV